MAEKNKGNKIIAQNKKAWHDYFVDEKYEAGIALFGTEVKSIRAGAVNLKDSYCTVKDGELYAVGIHISPYEHGNIFNRDHTTILSSIDIVEKRLATDAQLSFIISEIEREIG